MNYNNTSNPILKDSVFDVRDAQALPMTVNGVIRKSFIALFLLLGGAAFAWTRSYTSLESVNGKIVLFSLVALALYFVTIFNHDAARITVPLYALVEGLVIGSISWLFQQGCPGIVVQAATGTFGVFMAMLFIYRAGIIRPNEKFVMVIFSAMLGIAFIYLVDLMMSLFGFSGLSIINGSSNVSICFSVVVCIVAALRLLLNFEFIVRQSKMGAPEKLEWIAVFGLILTLVWIYLEILYLLAKLRNRNN